MSEIRYIAVQVGLAGKETVSIVAKRLATCRRGWIATQGSGPHHIVDSGEAITVSIAIRIRHA